MLTTISMNRRLKLNKVLDRPKPTSVNPKDKTMVNQTVKSKEVVLMALSSNTISSNQMLHIPQTLVPE